jgi:acetyl esterase
LETKEIEMSEAASPLDPIAQFFANNLPETAEDMRRLLDGFAALLNADMPAVGAFHEKVRVEGCPAEVTADVIVPEGAGPWPVLVYLHGGGWICGSPTTHRKLAHRFAESGHVVFNVDYRMAPEHPFPTPFEDCVEAIRWAARVAEAYGGDAARLAVGGDSAGGNLSAAAAIALHDDPSVEISAAVLIYGVFDFAALELGTSMPGATPEMAEAGENLVELMVGSYLGAGRGTVLGDPRVSPIHAAHRLPPSHIVCGSADPLARQAEALAEALEKAGVPHEHVVVEGMPHGFAQMEFFPQARQSIDRMVAFLAEHTG